MELSVRNRMAAYFFNPLVLRDLDCFWMLRRALFCVLYHGFPWFSAGLGPQSDPIFGVNP